MAKRISIRLTPAEKAHFAIMQLGQRDDLMADFILGGQQSPRMIAENDRKHEKYLNEMAKIIARYGVFKFYTDPLIQEEEQLRARIHQIKHELGIIRSHCPHKHNGRKKRLCPDCGAKLGI